MKKLLALILAATMVVSSGIVATAASTSILQATKKTASEQEDEYTFHVTNQKVASLNKNGKTTETWDLKNSRVSLSNYSKGGITIQLTLDDGTTKKLNTGNTKNLKMSGKMDILTLSSSLPKSVTIDLAENAKVSTLRVSFAGNVAIDGTVDKINITNSSANVAVSNQASVNSVTTVNSGSISGVSSSIVEEVESKTEDNPDGVLKGLGITDVVIGENKVTFYCEEEDADITVEGKLIGSSKKGKNYVNFPSAKPGDYFIVEITKDGFRTETINFSVSGYHTAEDKK